MHIGGRERIVGEHVDVEQRPGRLHLGRPGVLLRAWRFERGVPAFRCDWHDIGWDGARSGSVNGNGRNQ